MASKQQKSADNSALEQWLNRAKKGGAATPATTEIEPLGANAPALLSPGQERLWLLQQLNPESRQYNYAQHYQISGGVNTKALLDAFELVANRHSILRSNYVADGDQTVQRVQFDTLTVDHVPAEAMPNGLDAHIQHCIEQPFDLTESPLFRLFVYEQSSGSVDVLLVLHHIVGDAWSLGVINQEVSAAYKALAAGTTPELPPLRLQYKDVASWLRNRPTKPADLDYWKQQLAGELPVLALPKNNTSPATSSVGKTYKRLLGHQLSEQLKALATSSNSTMFALMLAAYKLLLSKYCGQSDVLVGTPFSNRDTPELEKLVGFFNETVVLRSTIDPGADFLQLVAQIRTNTIDAMAHKNVPFTTLVNTLQPNRADGENPLFQTMFLYNAPASGLSLGSDCTVQETMMDVGVSKFDLTLFVTEQAKGLEVALEHSLAFDDATIAGITNHFEVLLQNLVKQPNAPVGRISMLPDAEQLTITKRWNDTAKPLPDVPSVHTLFSQHAQQSPNAIAATFEGQSITYTELDTWSDGIAAAIQQETTGHNPFIGLYVHRSLEMVAGILGILKAGAAYLPLDPTYPEERIAYMLEDADVALVLTTDALAGASGLGARTKHLIQAPGNYATADLQPHHSMADSAYMIYTSGSTGKPKGVAVSHANLLHSTSARDHFYVDEMGAFLLLSSFSFDSSVVGIFWSLCTGGKLVLPPQRIEQDVERLTEIIHTEQVTHTLMLPSLYQTLLSLAQQEKLGSLKAVMVAGEACPTTLPETHFRALPNARLYNEYGPTEASVWCIAHEITASDSGNVIPIGKPIPNATAYILDANFNPVPAGVAAQLYIGGLGITPGYHNRPELTAERFISDPFSENGTLYCTGDLAKFRATGVIDFLGRADAQVKIRGHRVELEEVRTALLAHPEVSDAVVKVLGDVGTQKLAAWVQSTNSAVAAELKASLTVALPEYMVPATINVLETFPTLPNGKVHTQALEITETTTPADTEITAPTNATEQLLVELWQQVLNTDAIGIRDNFFQIGGDSLLSIQLVAKARAAGLRIGPTQLFDHQTIEALAPHIKAAETESATPAVEPENYPVTFPLAHQQRAFLFHSLQAENDQGILQLQFQLNGPLDADKLKAVWANIAELHPVLRTTIDAASADEPTQTIHATATPAWQHLDVSAAEKPEQATQLKSWLATDRAQGIDFTIPGCSRLALIALSETQHILCWTCHHMLLDGWSAAIIVKEALTLYAAPESTLPVAASMNQWNTWRTAQGTQEAEAHWSAKTWLETPALFSDFAPASPTENADYQDHTTFLDPAIVAALEAKTRAQNITLNTALQGLWMLVLSNYFSSNSITIGTTVAGRSGELAGMDRLAGLLMNVLPISTTVDKHAPLHHWLGELQRSLAEARQYEHIPADQIQAWTGNRATFDSLFVFGNFLADALDFGGLTLAGFSGGFSSTYPLTVRVNPAAQFEINLRYSTAALDATAASWLASTYQHFITTFAQEADAETTASQLFAPPPTLHKKAVAVSAPHAPDQPFAGAQNDTQLRLTQLWETLLGSKLIGINDNFFELGGTSLAALQLFSAIETEFGKKLSPTTLIAHPTIAQLSTLLTADDGSDAWSSIVPMKTSGSKAPLFCLHSGGAHVLFYQGLARHLTDDRPVYAIQPSGLDGEEAHHDSIHSMAAHYIAQMQRVQPHGPYHLVGTCFGNAVGIEMAHQLRALGESLAVLYVVDSAPAYIVPPSPNGERKPISRGLAMVREGNWNGIRKKFRNRFIRFNKKRTADQRVQQQVDLDEIVDTLNELYVRYHWKPVEDNVVLIRSREFSERKDKTFHLERWNFLASNGLELHEVEGHHLTLFDEPEVQGLAGAIGQHLQALENGSTAHQG